MTLVSRTTGPYRCPLETDSLSIFQWKELVMFSMSEQVMNSWRKSWTSLELTIGNQAKDEQAFEKLSKLFLPQQTRLLFEPQRRFQCFMGPEVALSFDW